MSDAAPIAGAPAAADETRSRLIDAAAEVFSEQGYAGSGVQAIAKRAGFTTGAIYGRFSGKAELLLAAIDERSNDELDDLFAEHGFRADAADVLNQVGSHLVTRRDTSGQLLLEAFVAARRDPEVAALVRQRLDDRAQLMAELIETSKVDGTIDPDLDTKSIVRFVHAVGLGFLLYDTIGLDLPAAGPWAELIERLVGAVAPDTAD
ncbi:MAG TPA: helix-turn-helix domain-containing protein [Acidimicrobiales bacterium]|nr:helix-turn-helix domain-containing protein [Acidimicrobiales bacterium]